TAPCHARSHRRSGTGGVLSQNTSRRCLPRRPVVGNACRRSVHEREEPKIVTRVIADAVPTRQRAPRPGAALTIGSLGFFLITLDILIVNVALPRIGVELGGGTAGKQWVIDG